MGLFEKKPYSTNDLSVREKGAVEAAMEIAINLMDDASVKKKMKTAVSHFKRGSLSADDLLVVVACIDASLEAIKKADASDMRTTLLMQKAEIEAQLAKASVKLKKFI